MTDPDTRITRTVKGESARECISARIQLVAEHEQFSLNRC